MDRQPVPRRGIPFTLLFRKRQVSGAIGIVAFISMLIVITMVPNQFDSRLVPYGLSLAFFLASLISGLGVDKAARNVREVFTDEVHVEVRQIIYDNRKVGHNNVLTSLFLILGVSSLVTYRLLW